MARALRAQGGGGGGGCERFRSRFSNGCEFSIEPLASTAAATPLLSNAPKRAAEDRLALCITAGLDRVLIGDGSALEFPSH